MSILEIKKEAKSIYKENRLRCIAISFIFAAIIMVFYFYEKMTIEISSKVNIIVRGIMLLFIIYLALGFKSFFLRLVNKEAANYYNLIQPKPNFFVYLLAKIEVLLIDIGFVLLLYILFKDVISIALIDKGAFNGIDIAADTVSKKTVLFLICLPVVLFNLLNVMIPYIYLEDSSLNPIKLMLISIKLMLKRVIPFVIIISDYLIWFVIRMVLLNLFNDPAMGIVLDYLTLFILAFWIVPYMQLEMALFYKSSKEKEELKKKNEEIENLA